MIDLLYEDALMLYQIGHYALAEKKLEKILQMAPFEKNAHFAYASTLQMQKKYLEAIEAWKRAIFLNTKNGQAYFHLAECLVSKDFMEEAKDTLRTAKHFASPELHTKIDQLQTSIQR